MSDFPRRLRELREDRGLTQLTLADRIGVTPMAISGYERGKRAPDLKTLQKIRYALGVSYNVLLGDPRKDSSLQPEAPRLSDHALKVAEKIESDPMLIKLFDIATMSDPEDIRIACDMLTRMKRT